MKCCLAQLSLWCNSQSSWGVMMISRAQPHFCQNSICPIHLIKWRIFQKKTWLPVDFMVHSLCTTSSQQHEHMYTTNTYTLKVTIANFMYFWKAKLWRQFQNNLKRQDSSLGWEMGILFQCTQSYNSLSQAFCKTCVNGSLPIEFFASKSFYSSKLMDLDLMVTGFTGSRV